MTKLCKIQATLMFECQFVMWDGNSAVNKYQRERRTADFAAELIRSSIDEYDISTNWKVI